MVIKDQSELVVNGANLLEWRKEKPGPWLSEYLENIVVAVLNREVENEKDKIKEWLIEVQSDVRTKLIEAFSDADGYIYFRSTDCQIILVVPEQLYGSISKNYERKVLVWKLLGIKGYRIIFTPEKVTANEIQLGLQTKTLGKSIHYEESVETTQKIAHTLANDGAPEGTLVVAEEQLGGKGRLNT